MEPSDIDTTAQLQRLRGVASCYRADFDIEVVPSIQGWSQVHGVPEDNPFRSGKVVRSNETGRYLVLLANPITASMVSSVLNAMLIRHRATEAQVEHLAEPGRFLTHLLLHEIAHALDESRSEYECDQWAFEQLELEHAA